MRKDELRHVLLALSGTTRSGTKESLIEAILESSSAADVERAASRIEAIGAYKHSWLFTMGDKWPRRASSADVVSWQRALFPGISKKLTELDVGSAALQPTTQILDESRGRIYLKFTQWVKTRRLEEFSPNQFRFIEEAVRHPVTAVLKSDMCTLEVRFNGFTQGRNMRAHERLRYPDIAEGVRQTIADRLSLPIRGFAPSAPVKALLREFPRQLSELGVVNRGADGSVAIRSQEGAAGEDAASVLARMLGEGFSKAEVKEALRDAPADSVLLGWPQLGLNTRVAGHVGATEVLFFWRGKRDVAAVDEIVGKVFASHAATRSTGKYQFIRQYIEDMRPGTTFLLSDLAKRFDERLDWLVAIIEGARRENLVERRYRVRVEGYLHDYQNVWRDKPAALPERVIDEDDVEIDLKDPENIEVGYCRL